MVPLNEYILIPELAIDKIITESLSFLRRDFIDNTNEKDTFLFQLTNSIGSQRLSFFDQAKVLFLADKTDPKKINVSLGYPDLVKHAISIAILNAGSNHSQNVLSVDENQTSTYDNTPVSGSYSEGNLGLGEDALNIQNGWRQTFGRYYDSTYRVVITTDNYNETLIIFNVLKSLFIAFEGTGHLSALGFMNLKINDADIQLNSNTTKKTFQKIIQLSFTYQYRVPGLQKFKFANGIIFKGVLKDI